MPYHILAESFNEIERFSAFVNQLERGVVPASALEKGYLEAEVNRIKMQIARNILLFGNNADIYLRVQLMQVYDLTGRTLEVRSQMLKIYFPTEDQQCRLYLCTEVRCQLGNLAEFLEAMKHGLG